MENRYTNRNTIKYSFLISLAFFVITSVVQAQPAVSRGEQRFNITYEEGMRRAKAALLAENYSIVQEGNASLIAHKDIHTAVIMCNIGTGFYTINTVVASCGVFDGGVPGSERVRLQERMAQTGQVGGNTLPISGTWIISQGSLTGTLRLFQSGANLSGSMDWDNYPDATVESGSYTNGKATFVLSHSNGVKGAYTADVEPSGRTMINGTTASGGTSASWYGTKKE